MAEKKVMLLIGSPKKSKSTSEALGTYLLEELGYPSETYHLSKESLDPLLEKIKEIDLLILSFPLYVDSLPAPLMEVLEALMIYRKENPPIRQQKLLAIVNCGFPEAFHNDKALEICQHFAQAVHFEWCGGLSISMGPAMRGILENKLNGVGRHVVKALKETAKALRKGERVSKKTIETLKKPPMPHAFYLFMAHRGWKCQASKNKVKKYLYDQPYNC